MGQVYEAFDRSTQSLVALKTLQRITPGGIYRLKREFRAFSGVTHENLVRTFELFEDGGAWFFTMELVRGVPLDAYVARAKSELTLRRLLGQLVAGVAAIHAAGKVHRDLKPSNVLVNEHERLTILDFGLVSETKERPFNDGDTRDGAIVGTPAYMAPEQRLGQATAASDMYALGLILWQLLAFDEADPRTHVGQFSFGGQDGPAPSSLRPGVPADLDALCVRLLRRDPTQRPTAAEVQQLLPPPVPRTRASVENPAQSKLLGRESQVEQLAAALEAAALGAPQVVLVEGPSGIGKSSLLGQFVNQVRQSGRALAFEGHCYENESVPYKGVEAIVDEIARYLGSTPHGQSLIPAGIAALARVFPTVARVEAVAQLLPSSPLASDEQSLRDEAFRCLRELLMRCSADRPLLICLDDAQWADEDTAALLGYALSSPRGTRILFVAACRTDAEPTGFVPRFVTACKSNALLLGRIALPPLPDDAAQQLVTSLLADPVRSALVLAEAQGHPFLLHEYCRFFADLRHEPATTSVSGVILARMAGLGGAARMLVELVALAATPLQRRTILHALGSPEELSFEGTVASLCDARLLRPCTGSSRESLICYHDRVRTAVVGALDESQRRAIHERLLDALRLTHATDLEALALHSAGAGRFRDAATLAERAGDNAMVNLAFHRAACRYRDSLQWGADLESQGALHVKLAQSLAKAGHGVAAADAYILAARQPANARLAYELRTKAAEQYLITGHNREGTRLLNALLSEKRVGVPATRWGPYVPYLIERTRLKWALARQRRMSARELRSGIPLTAVPDGAYPTTALARQRLEVCRVAACTFGITDIVQGAAYATRHLRLAIAAGDASHVLHGLGTELVAVASAGPKARPQVWGLIQSAQPWRRRADTPAIAYFEATCGAARVLMGDFVAGAELAERAELELRSRCSGVTRELNIARTFMAIAWAATGELRLLSERVPHWLRDARERADVYAATHLSLTLPLTFLAADDVSAALKTVTDAEHAWRAERFDQVALNICDVRTAIELYRGPDPAALRSLRQRYGQALRTPLAYAHGNRVFSHYFAGCCDLGLLDLKDPDAGSLARVARHAAVLRKDRAAYARGYGALLAAAVHFRRGATAAALSELESGSLELQSAGATLVAVAAQLRLGRLLGGHTEAARVTTALEALRVRGVLCPERFAAALLPGFG